ncbi:MAG: hypothetical protein HOJ21_12095 [Alphaproteobacteria bacterium]|nr:hypothetical protein [Alphaproteobacteria bacterium]
MIAADEIPLELARILEFMNEQMRAEVWGVELRYYEASDGRRTLVPRIIGDTAKSYLNRTRNSRAPAPHISQEDWLQEYIEPLDPRTKAGVDIMLEFLNERSASVEVNNSGYAISGAFERVSGRLAYLFRIRQDGSIRIDFGWSKTYPQLNNEQLRIEIQQEFNQVLKGNLKTTTKSHSGAPSFDASLLTQKQVFSEFQIIADKYISLATQ